MTEQFPAKKLLPVRAFVSPKALLCSVDLSCPNCSHLKTCNRLDCRVKPSKSWMYVQTKHSLIKRDTKLFKSLRTYYSPLGHAVSIMDTGTLNERTVTSCRTSVWTITVNIWHLNIFFAHQYHNNPDIVRTILTDMLHCSHIRQQEHFHSNCLITQTPVKQFDSVFRTFLTKQFNPCIENIREMVKQRCSIKFNGVYSQKITAFHQQIFSSNKYTFINSVNLQD